MCFNHSRSVEIWLTTSLQSRQRLLCSDSQTSKRLLGPFLFFNPWRYAVIIGRLEFETRDGLVNGRFLFFGFFFFECRAFFGTSQYLSVNSRKLAVRDLYVVVPLSNATWRGFLDRLSNVENWNVPFDFILLFTVHSSRNGRKKYDPSRK